MNREGDVWDYEGDLDENDMACGYGVAVSRMGSTYQGSFFNDKFEGIGILIAPKNAWQYHGEFKAGREHGKITFYSNVNDHCGNMLFYRIQVNG